ncbi:aminoacyl-tRNA hydrolase [Aminipila sp.]|uniref:aminoacyl-tRNA hydrolase n=1 Tax=Aminipila sp. TaxID=2060095 RepID=UPI00289692EB|nr:aminoacyl-tRNA hydrolase [Aminipila sp.]
MYIIVGLGNPGKKYENTRHNIGFITLDYLADRHGIKITKIKHKALVGEGNISGQKVLLVKPQTYMNLSGNSVREVMEYYKADIENLLVIYDDIDIPSGSVRIRKKGSAGTHNGMRSVVYDLQSDQFPRIRIGMGNNKSADLKDFVVGGFSKGEKEIFERAVLHTADAIECFLQFGIDKAMNEYNTKGVVGEEKGNE